MAGMAGLEKNFIAAFLCNVNPCEDSVFGRRLAALLQIEEKWRLNLCFGINP